MKVDFQILETQLDEAEMALLMMLNVSINASMLAGANPDLILQHLQQHADNFEKLGQKKAAHMVSAMILLVNNALGRPTK